MSDETPEKQLVEHVPTAAAEKREAEEGGAQEQGEEREEEETLPTSVQLKTLLSAYLDEDVEEFNHIQGVTRQNIVAAKLGEGHELNSLQVKVGAVSEFRSKMEKLQSDAEAIRGSNIKAIVDCNR